MSDTVHVGCGCGDGIPASFARAQLTLNAVKWTSTLSNKLVFDAGYGTSVNSYTEKFLPGIKQERYSPAWYPTSRARTSIA